MTSRRWVSKTLLVLLIVALGAAGTAGQDHSAHQMAAKSSSYKKSIETYEIPELTLLNQDGDEVAVQSVLDPPRPVGVTFIFTTCTTICPVMTATFRRMQDRLGDAADGINLVTISIDPEFDTPPVLKKYSERYGFGPEWQFLTGKSDEVTTLLKAFDAYYGDKMNHKPLYFLKRPGTKEWVRIEGLASGSDMVHEYHALVHP